MSNFQYIKKYLSSLVVSQDQEASGRWEFWWSIFGIYHLDDSLRVTCCFTLGCGIAEVITFLFYSSLQP